MRMSNVNTTLSYKGIPVQEAPANAGVEMLFHVSYPCNCYHKLLHFFLVNSKDVPPNHNFKNFAIVKLKNSYQLKNPYISLNIENI